MPANPYPYWVTEQSPYHRGPTGAGVLRLVVLVIIIVIAWQWFAPTESGARQVDRREGVSLCEEHRGQPGWQSVCR